MQAYVRREPNNDPKIVEKVLEKVKIFHIRLFLLTFRTELYKFSRLVTGIHTVRCYTIRYSVCFK